MKTPKEKAKELLDKFVEIQNNNFLRKKTDVEYSFLAQLYCLTCIDEILNVASEIQHKYWNEVKLEILKL